MWCINQSLLVMLYSIISHEDYLTSCLLVTKFYVYIAQTDVAVLENTHRFTFMCDSSWRQSYYSPLICVLLLTVCYLKHCFSSFLSYIPPSWTENLLVPLGTLLVSIRWKNLLKITLQYNSVLLLAVVPQLVEFWHSGFGLVSLLKCIPLSCLSLPFPTSGYSNQMLKLVSLEGMTCIFCLWWQLWDVIEELTRTTMIFEVPLFWHSVWH